LLQAIARTGSIRQAAKEMGMSYKRAWSLVQALNALGPEPMVVKEVGGKHGGGARLTPFGEHTLKVYAQVENHLKACVTELEQWLIWPQKEVNDEQN
jgi:molybdate transport system regulatory protein